LKLTIDGLARRDALVCDYARRHHVPLVITLAGGYARRVDDTVKIHIGTILAARDAAALAGARQKSEKA
jgi:acetoin utilization deacetylase AcuC-like enzyme